MISIHVLYKLTSDFYPNHEKNEKFEEEDRMRQSGMSQNAKNNKPTQTSIYITPINGDQQKGTRATINSRASNATVNKSVTVHKCAFDGSKTTRVYY